MSTHIDVRSESVTHTEAASPEPPVISQRRVTIFERPEIMEGLSPVVIGAIQRELVEFRMELEAKIEDLERRADRRVRDVIQLGSDERVDMEKLRLAHKERWETGTGSTAASRSPSKERSQRRA